MGTISQDHFKLDSDTVGEAIRPLVEIDPSIKVKSMIAEGQSRFNYTISYQKAWLAKQKSITKVFDGLEDSYQAVLSHGLEDRIEVNMQYAGNIVVHGFDRRNEVFKLYVNDVYKMIEVRKVYKFEFVPLGDPETWPSYPGPTLVANPDLRQTSKGDPKLTRYLNEMDSCKMRGPRICHLCGRQGHNQSRCPQRAGPSGVGDDGGP
ncbi:hypothetical protein Ahy_A04g019466 [Arachis hypogaea]|uniref:CCHC-type domain-containing protein n=1 Tax=Arachis hypogaea TaxID=3818 RepID=A0A445DFZ0_ARAHY|nr:hypothetical protein Ahy_A04g019466 [Arachis hypogaea]